MKGICFSLLTLLLMISCSGRKIHDLEGMNVTTIESSPQKLSNLMGNKATVFVLMSPDCPLCVNYTSVIKELDVEFHKSGMNMLLVFPGIYYSNEEISLFLSKYGLSFPAILDTKLELTKKLEGTTTPQAVVVDHEMNLIYTGAIDDWSYGLGKKRYVVQKHYLKDALTAVERGVEPAIRKTEAIGCIIED